MPNSRFMPGRGLSFEKRGFSGLRLTCKRTCGDVREDAGDASGDRDRPRGSSRTSSSPRWSREAIPSEVGEVGVSRRLGEARLKIASSWRRMCGPSIASTREPGDQADDRS